MHRFTWDVHYQPIDGRESSRRTDAADCRDRSQHRAGADDAVGQSRHLHRAFDRQRQGLHATDRGQAGSAREDAALAMQQVYSLSKATYDGAVAAQEAVRQAGEIRDQIAKVRSQASGPSGEALAAFDRKVEALVGAPAGGGRGRGQGSGGGRGGAPGGVPHRDTDERRCGTVGSHDLPAGRRRAADDDAVERDCERACVGYACDDAMGDTSNNGIGGAERDAEVGGHGGDRCARFFESAEVAGHVQSTPAAAAAEGTGKRRRFTNGGTKRRETKRRRQRDERRTARARVPTVGRRPRRRATRGASPVFSVCPSFAPFLRL